MKIQWIGQDDPDGCGIAVLAMLTGKSYAEVFKYFAERRPTGSQMNVYLAEHGLATALLYSSSPFGENRPWPPEPGRLAMCNVRLPNAMINHWVVWMPDGKVLDPLTKTPKSLSDYEVVNNVNYIAPIIPIGSPQHLEKREKALALLAAPDKEESGGH